MTFDEYLEVKWWDLAIGLSLGALVILGALLVVAVVALRESRQREPRQRREMPSPPPPPPPIGHQPRNPRPLNKPPESISLSAYTGRVLEKTRQMHEQRKRNRPPKR